MEVVINFAEQKDKERLWTYLKPLNKTYRISIDRKTRRLSWNKYYWGTILKTIADYVGEDDLVYLHENMKVRFNPQFAGDGRTTEKIIGGSTRTLPQDEFIEYCQRIQRWAASFLGLYIPDYGEYLDRTKAVLES